MDHRAKRIGLIGGTSWESTLEYYRLINRRSAAVLGGDHTAEILLWSLDFGEVLALKRRGAFAALARQFRDAACGLVEQGAELLAICSNAGHQRADDIAGAVPVPLVHIVDAVGAELRRRGVSEVGLLGTLDTMQGGFYRDKLRRDWTIEVCVPAPGVQARVHAIAVEEVARGVRAEGSRRELAAIIDGLCPAGVVLGCTELPLLVAPQDARVPVFDSLALHVDAIVAHAIG
ncbi:MAG TPA: amino acid racemase [Reyranella sp.]|nr:amino acid racemase [Reyranella sp.]